MMAILVSKEMIRVEQKAFMQVRGNFESLEAFDDPPLVLQLQFVKMAWLRKILGNMHSQSMDLFHWFYGIMCIFLNERQPSDKQIKSLQKS